MDVKSSNKSSALIEDYKTEGADFLVARSQRKTKIQLKKSINRAEYLTSYSSDYFLPL